jgi:hypothetical protein
MNTWPVMLCTPGSKSQCVIIATYQRALMATTAHTIYHHKLFDAAHLLQKQPWDIAQLLETTLPQGTLLARPMVVQSTQCVEHRRYASVSAVRHTAMTAMNGTPVALWPVTIRIWIDDLDAIT